MAKLYPPIMGDIIPAFYGNSITVPFSLNRATSISEVSGMKLIVKSPVTNNKLGTFSSSSFSSTSAIFDISKITDQLYSGGFVKLQLAFISKADDSVGYYSEVGKAKYVGADAPEVTIEKLTGGFCATYSCEDITEKMFSYIFNLYDSDGNLLDTSDEQLHDSTGDVGTTQTDSWYSSLMYDSGENYTVEFKMTTVNSLELSTTQAVTANKDEEGYCPRAIKLSAILHRDNGYVNISISSSIKNDTRNLIYGTFEIFKTSSKDNYKSKYRIAYFTLENQDLYEKEFKDLTVESGYSYQYILQQVNDYGIYSEEIASNIVDVNYDDLFLFDGNRQLRIEFNPKVSSFKDTILEQKIDTIGSKFPFVFRNKTVKYKEIPISGLISYKMDDENLFMTDNEIWVNNEGVADWTHNLVDTNISAEKVFKLAVQEWLENGEPKLFKSPVEGTYIVRLFSVSLSPVDQLGRMLHSFTATAYEVENVEDYDFCQALTVDRNGKYIGYRTIPLYEFPLKNIVYNGENGLVTITNNTLYEIIGNNALEYVVGVRFEDIKPRTKFKVTLERGTDITTITIRIGATGVYVIPRELGYHIKSIHLVEKDWNTGDYTSDIINNRGQVTYEFERQAAHNNFNDITAIDAKTIIAAPWYPTTLKTYISEPLVNYDNQILYTYEKNYDQNGYVAVLEDVNGNYYVVGSTCKAVEAPGGGEKIYLVTSNKIEQTMWYYLPDTEGVWAYNYYHDSDKIWDTLDEVQQAVIENEVDGYYVMDVEGGKYGKVYFPPLKKLTNYGLIEPAITGGEKKEIGEAVYKFIETEVLTYTGDSSSVDTGNITYNHTDYGWESQTVSADNSYTYLQVYKFPTNFNKNARYLYNQGNNMEKYSSDGEFDDTKIFLNTQSGETWEGAILYIPDTDNQGTRIYSHLVTSDEGEYQNPFYTQLYNITLNDDQITYTATGITVPHYSLQVLYNTNSNLVTTDTENIEIFSIPRNFLANRYYDQQNVNGEYYNKETVLNIYNLYFQQIQVFYEEKMEDIWNYTYNNCYSIYEDIYEDAGYQGTKRYIGIRGDASSLGGYKEDGSSLTEGAVLYDSELLQDIIFLGRVEGIDNNVEENTDYVTSYLIDKRIQDVKSESGDIISNWDALIVKLYGLPETYDEAVASIKEEKGENSTVTIVDLIQRYYKYFTFYVKDIYGSQGSGVYEIKKYNEDIDEVIKILNGEVEASHSAIYLNYRTQAIKNYINATRPDDNSIIVTYEADENDVPALREVRLRDRLDYEIKTDDKEYGIQNISGIYLGDNIRGFCSYKRKGYSYNIDGVEYTWSRGG